MKKQLKKILALVLVILFITLTPIMSYINIDNNVYAEPIVLTGIAIKVVAMILASMGTLKFVNEHIGMDEFYQGLLEFAEDVKGLLDFQQALINIAVQGIIASAKMKIQEISNVISEYYNTLQSSFIIEPPLFENIENVKALNTKSYTGLKSSYPATDETLIIGNGYEYVYSLYSTSNNYKLRGNLHHNGYPTSLLTFYENLSPISNLGSNTNSINLEYKIQVSDSLLLFSWQIINYTKNEIYTGYNSLPVDPLVGFAQLSDLPYIDDIIMPKDLSVPINLTFPWDLGIDTEDVLGLDIEGLLEVINNLQLEEYLDRLLDLPKSITDAMYPPVITVEDGVITGVTDTTWDDVLAEGKEHTTILERIADRIDVLINKVDDFFNPEKNPPAEDDNGTDWGNFKNFFDIFWIFYYLIILAIIILLKFFSVILSLMSIPVNTALFDNYPTILSGLNYIKSIKVGGFNVTLQQIFEYMFTVFFFLYIVTTLQKLYHSFQGIERQSQREVQREEKRYDSSRNYQYNPSNIDAPIHIQRNDGSVFDINNDELNNIKITDYTKGGD